MRAAIITEPGHVEVQSVPRPSPEANEVLVKLHGCGVCASNLAVWKGAPWFNYPLSPGEPGHEGWGVVAEVGADVGGLKPGDPVAMLSGHAYADYDKAASDQVVKLPPTFANTPFPGEPLGCAVNIFRRSQIAPGMNVAIVGVGFLGALLTRLAVNCGAHVIAISGRATSLDAARMYGANERIVMDDHWRIINDVMGMTNGTGCEVVIECTGKQWPLDLSAELTRERGRLVIAGYHQDGPRQVNMQLWNWRGLDVINAHERDPQVYIDGMREAARLVAEGELDPSPLYTHTFALDQLGAALQTADERPEGFIKALVNIAS